MTAFLHVALISAALDLKKQDKPAQQRSGIEAAPCLQRANERIQGCAAERTTLTLRDTWR
jgi:hypothetical protein